MGQGWLVPLPSALEDLLVQTESGQAIGKPGLEKPLHLLKVHVVVDAIQTAEGFIDPRIDIFWRPGADLLERGGQPNGEVGMAAGPIEHPLEHPAAVLGLPAQHGFDCGKVVPLEIEVPELEGAANVVGRGAPVFDELVRPRDADQAEREPLVRGNQRPRVVHAAKRGEQVIGPRQLERAVDLVEKNDNRTAILFTDDLAEEAHQALVDGFRPSAPTTTPQGRA